jgi:hypothetical protein
MFTLGSGRMIIRGDANLIQIPQDLFEKLKSEGWRWSAHTHVGCKDLVLNASGIRGGDREVLQLLGQDRSLILNSTGRRNVFDLSDDMHLSSSVVKDALAKPSSSKKFKP